MTVSTAYTVLAEKQSWNKVCDSALISHIQLDTTILQTRILTQIQTQTQTQTRLVLSQVPPASQAVLDHPVNRGLRDPQDPQAQRALKATLDLKAPLDLKARRVQEESRERMERTGNQEIQDQWDPKARRVRMETMAGQEPMVVQGNQDLQDKRDHRGSVTAGPAGTAHTVDRTDELIN